MNLLQLQDASKSFGSKLLFENATFSINEGEHVGVIGPNGAGKTTLFKLLAGELTVDSGEIVRSRELSLGYLRQHDTWNENETVEEFLSRDLKKPIWELQQLGHGLGLSDAQFAAPIKSLSGGYRMRVKLLHLLGEEPNLMMLDEPTNYLDLETLLVLEEFLQDYRGAFLLISHDREFLRRTTDHILEIENGDFVKYSGTIDDYFEQKEMLRGQLAKAALSQAARKKEILDFAARFGAKASKARQVQSRLKRLDKMENIELKPLPLSAKIRIPEPIRCGRVALEVKDADLGYPEKAILGNLSLTIESGSRIGVVGYNGAGKSTLLKSIAQEIAPLYGSIDYGYQISSAYYAQHVAERLKPQDTVLEALSGSAHPSVRQQEILDLAGSLLFSGDQVKKRISVLSGGEKARVALGQMLLKKAPLLLLDEPTNHLDFYTVESLTQALEAYAGTVVLVSHDRGFVRRVATKILEVRNGQVNLYPGTYDDYVWNIQKRQHEGLDEPAPPKPLIARERITASPQVGANPPIQKSPSPAATISNTVNKEKIKKLEGDKRSYDKTIQDLDRKLKALTSRLEEQAQSLSNGSLANDSEKAKDLAREMGAAQRKIQELEDEMLATMEKRESAAQEIESLKKSFV